jgi:drug/metabolite transporter (DMT)-like permease
MGWKIFFLLAGLLAFSISPVFIKLANASPYTIAFYRVFFSSVFLFPFLSFSGIKDIFSRKSSHRFLYILGAVLFSIHIITWIIGLQLISVFEALVIISTSPVYVALGAYVFFGEKPRKYFLTAFILSWLGIIIAFSEKNIFTDIRSSGFIYIFISTLLFSAYFLVGKKARTRIDTFNYIFIINIISSLVCLFALLLKKAPVTDYPVKSYIYFILIAVFPTIIGHGSLNHCVKYFRASTITLLKLFEPVLGSIVAFIVLGETVDIRIFYGFMLICLGIILLFSSNFVTLLRMIRS